MKEKSILMLPFILAILLIIVLLFNTFMMFDLNEAIKSKIGAIAAEKTAAKLVLIGINVGECADCYNISTVISKLKNLNVNITSKDVIDWKSSNAKELIQKYNIQSVPTLLVFGEINKSSSLVSFWNTYGEKREDALVLTKQTPIYYDTATGNAIGRVSAIYLNATKCTECVDQSGWIDTFKQNDIIMDGVTYVDVDSPQGTELADKYNISFVPTFIFSSDMGAYDIIKQNWNGLGTVEEDGSYVLRYKAVPYYDLKTLKVRGLVTLTYLTDKSCTSCYNVSIHKSIFGNPLGFAMKIVNETTYDISDPTGKALIDKYKITNVPTVIMKGDPAAYARLTAVWPQVGTVDSDGSYVFRNVGLLGVVYMNLTSGKIVNASMPTAAQ
jgi:hypothetical protein